MDIEGLTIDQIKTIVGDMYLTQHMLNLHIQKLEAQRPPLDEAADADIQVRHDNGADTTAIPLGAAQ